MRVARAFWAVAVVGLPLAGGCEDVGDFLKTDRTRFLGPEKVVRQPEGSPINPILGTIGPTDRSREIIPNAAFPKEGDWSYTEEDYIIGTTDILDISVLDLFADGVETVLRRQVSDTGFIDLPLLPQRIKAEGYTKEELRVVIENVYRPDILREPTVSVTVAARRNDTFSVLGAVNRPGTYNILRKHMRLLEALALAGGITQTNIYYIYVIRPGPATRLPGKPRAPVTTQPFKLPPLPPEIKPTTVPATKPATKPAKEGPEAALRELGKVLPGIATQPATKPVKPSVVRFVEMSPAGSAPASKPARKDPDLGEAARPDRWIYTGGKWVRVATQPATTKPAKVAKVARTAERPDPFGWAAVDKSGQARVIAINLQQLRDGDPRMNVVIRNNDVVHVPTLQVGEFYVMGEVLRPGVYSLTGRRITVKMAVAAAGNMTALAWPENSILIRRIGGYQEQIIPLDLEGIFQGEEPDIFLKPNDVIAVGTDVRSTFMAVMRNAFRMTYGFGFIYDRNFADLQPLTPTSRRFTRW